MHKEISKKIQYDAYYESHADLDRKHLEFNESDFVMIQIRLERFPSGIIKKLHTRSVDSYKILKKLIQIPMQLIYFWILGLVRHLIFQT